MWLINSLCVTQTKDECHVQTLEKRPQCQVGIHSGYQRTDETAARVAKQRLLSRH